jgi:hypothetical protein
MANATQITINGKSYIERPQFFPLDVAVTADNVYLQNQRLNLPGLAPFRLKALTRETLVAGVATACAFKFKLGNTEGGVWYCGAGIGGTNDLVVDTLLFGNGQFPFPVIPSIIYESNASIMFEIQDLTGSATATPYTISLCFHGSYLFPAS